MSEAVTKKYLDCKIAGLAQAMKAGFKQTQQETAQELTKARQESATEFAKVRQESSREFKDVRREFAQTRQETAQEFKSVRQEFTRARKDLGVHIDTKIDSLAEMTQRAFSEVHEQIKNITVFEIRQIKKDVHNIQGRVTLIEAALDMSK
jgi:F0F1-type ATP synthase membrane subunit b/b'